MNFVSCKINPYFFTALRFDKYNLFHLYVRLHAVLGNLLKKIGNLLFNLSFSNHPFHIVQFLQKVILYVTSWIACHYRTFSRPCDNPLFSGMLQAQFRPRYTHWTTHFAENKLFISFGTYLHYNVVKTLSL